VSGRDGDDAPDGDGVESAASVVRSPAWYWALARSASGVARIEPVVEMQSQVSSMIQVSRRESSE
jgi:hypothetical protein